MNASKDVHIFDTYPKNYNYTSRRRVKDNYYCTNMVHDNLCLGLVKTTGDDMFTAILLKG